MRVLVLGSGAREHALVARLVVGTRLRLSVVARQGIQASRAWHARSRWISGHRRASLRLWRRANGSTSRSSVLNFRSASASPIALPPRASGCSGRPRRRRGLETSKAFAKAFMQRHHVPTARFRTCTIARRGAGRRARAARSARPSCSRLTDSRPARASSSRRRHDEAEVALTAAMRDGSSARRRDDRHRGMPVGTGSVVLPRLRRDARPADRQRAGSQADLRRRSGTEHGRYGRVRAEPDFSDAPLQARVMREVVEPVMTGMAAEGYPFVGFLYVGLMLTRGRPEGDRIQRPHGRSGNAGRDAAHRRAACFRFSSRQPTAARAADAAAWRPIGCVCVVIASRGYPESSESGQRHRRRRRRGGGCRASPSVTRARRMRDGALVTAGGRVLTVVGRGPDFPQAIARAYAGVARIQLRRHAISSRHRPQRSAEVLRCHVRLPRQPGRLARLRGGSARARRRGCRSGRG